MVRAVTAGGEHKAASMASARLRGQYDSDIAIYTVELIATEDEYDLDPANDVIDYFESA